MRRIMGDDWVNKEIELIKNFRQPEQPEESQPEPSNEQPPDTEQNQEEQTQETTERKRPIQLIKKRRNLQKKEPKK